MSLRNPWHQYLLKQPLPILSFAKDTPIGLSSVKQWVSLGERDPLFAAYLFNHTNKLLEQKQTQVKSLKHAITLIGVANVATLHRQLSKNTISPKDHPVLMQTIGDSYLATELLGQWCISRHMPWTEEDYWAGLFHQFGDWLMAYYQPEKFSMLTGQLHSSKYRKQAVEKLSHGQNNWYLSSAKWMRLPHIDSQLAEQEQPQVAVYKLQALRYFLPISHELAYRLRFSWQQSQTQQVFESLKGLLAVENFSTQFVHWLVNASRKCQLPQSHIAISQWVSQEQVSSNSQNSHSICEKQGNKRLYEQILKGFSQQHALKPLLATALKGITLGIGLKRMLFFKVNKNNLTALTAVGFDLAKNPISFPLKQSNLAVKVSARPKAQWVNDDQYPNDILTISTKINKTDVLLLPVFFKQQLIGLFYADNFGGKSHITTQDFQLFRNLGHRLNEQLSGLVQKT